MDRFAGRVELFLLDKDTRPSTKKGARDDEEESLEILPHPSFYRTFIATVLPQQQRKTSGGAAAEG